MYFESDIKAQQQHHEACATFQPSRADANTVASFAAFGPEKHRRAQLAAAEWRANPQLRAISLEDHLKFSVPGVCDRPFDGKQAPRAPFEVLGPAQFASTPGVLYEGNPFAGVKPSTRSAEDFIRDDGHDDEGQGFDVEGAQAWNEKLVRERAKYYDPLRGELPYQGPSGRAVTSYPASVSPQTLAAIEDRERRDRQLVEDRIRAKRANDAILEALAAKERQQREEKRRVRDLAERQADAREAHRSTWR
jgi:hypothetical protein